MEEEIKSLEEQITYYAEKYYKGEPQISDEQFDALVDKLRSLKPNSDVLKTGWGFEVKGDKVKHKYTHIGSLDKCKSFDEMSDQFKNTQIYISPKLDGISAVVYYKNGILVQAITRGNGEYGKDITDKMKIIIGSEIPDKTFTGAVRGELIIHKDNWIQLQQKYGDLISSRNYVAGIINRKDIDADIKYVDLVVYKVTGQEINRHQTPKINKLEVLIWLSDNFKNHVPIYYLYNDKDGWESNHREIFNNFKTHGYDLDGLVLTRNEIQYVSTWEEERHIYGYVYTECAFKFGSEVAETTIKELEWTLSKNNRYIPVAILEPVQLAGANITRATCNNAKMVKDLMLGKGALVNITRSNEVIPQILEVIETSDEVLPTHCPVCGSELIWEGVDLKCVNENCPNIDASDLEQWCLNIGETEGLQYTIMKQYLDMYSITTLAELYDISNQMRIWNDLNNRTLSITEEKIKEFFKKLYFEKCPIEKILLGLNIPRLGGKTALALGKYPLLIKEVLIWSINRCYDIKDISRYVNISQSLKEVVKDATTESILSNYKKFSHIRYMYHDGNFITEDARIIFNTFIESNDEKYIAVTGSLQTMKRKDFEKLITTHGYTLTSNLKKCQYLVNNDINSTSTKNKQAKEYNIPIITEADFLNLLK